MTKQTAGYAIAHLKASKRNLDEGLAAANAEILRLRHVILAVAKDLEGVSRDQTVDISTLTYDYLMSAVKKIKESDGAGQ